MLPAPSKDAETVAKRNEDMQSQSLLALGFGPGLAQHLACFDPASLLGFRCQPPFGWASSKLADQTVTAIWQCGTCIVYFDCAVRVFRGCSLEAVDQPFFEYRSAQAVMGELLLDLYEDDCSDAQMREAASLLGFLHIDRLLDEAADLGGRDYGDWRRCFPKTCDDECKVG